MQIPQKNIDEAVNYLVFRTKREMKLTKTVSQLHEARLTGFTSLNSYLLLFPEGNNACKVRLAIADIRSFSDQHLTTFYPGGVGRSSVQPSGAVDQVTTYPFVVGE